MASPPKTKLSGQMLMALGAACLQPDQLQTVNVSWLTMQNPNDDPVL